jgi:hypothetical protein
MTAQNRRSARSGFWLRKKQRGTEERRAVISMFSESENVEVACLEIPRQNSNDSHFDVLRILKT